MRENDYIEYCGVKFSNIYKNKNLEYAIQCVAYKYGITCNIGGIEIPKWKQTKAFICDKCLSYFDVKITYKQISYLLRPQKGKFPYTSIILIETIYNLLKENDGNSKWKAEMRKYLISRKQDYKKYESFMLGNLSKDIAEKTDEFMNGPYFEIYRGFIDSRKKYLEKIMDITMIEHLDRDFPSEFFSKDDVPDSIYRYQKNRIYIEVEGKWNI